MVSDDAPEETVPDSIEPEENEPAVEAASASGAKTPETPATQPQPPDPVTPEPAKPVPATQAAPSNVAQAASPKLEIAVASPSADLEETALEDIDLSQTQFNSREEMLEAHRQMQADAQELLASLNLPASSFKLSIKNSNGVEIEITDTSNRAVESSKEPKKKGKAKPVAAIKAQKQVAAL